MSRAPLLVRSGFATEASVDGIILVSGMIVVSGGSGTSSWGVFVSVFGTVIVFWAAKVYAGTVAGHGAMVDGEKVTLATSLRRSLRRCLGFLTAALLPSLVLLGGALRVVDDSMAIWLALWLGVAILAILGYIAFARRGSTWPGRIAGSLGTAAFGFAMIVLQTVIQRPEAA